MKKLYLLFLFVPLFFATSVFATTTISDSSAVIGSSITCSSGYVYGYLPTNSANPPDTSVSACASVKALTWNAWTGITSSKTNYHVAVSTTTFCATATASACASDENTTPSTYDITYVAPPPPPPSALITLPETAVADLTGAAGHILSDVWVLVALLAGIPLGFYIIRKTIGLFAKK
jgi:hypothetical protein